MRFTDGQWSVAKGLKIHSSKCLWEYDIDGTGLHLMVPCAVVRDLNDTTYGPVLEIDITAPREDILSVKTSHYTGGVEKGPYFGFNMQPGALGVEETGQSIIVKSGKLEAVIPKNGMFRIDFYYQGRRIVTNGEETLAYVTDLDYGAEDWCDFNHREKPASYRKETYMRGQLSAGIGECFYGLGEHFTAFVRNGQRLDTWNRDGGTNGDQSYKSIPFYLSNYGYGVLVNHPGYVDFEVATECARKVQFSVEGESLEYLVIGGGTPKMALSNYTALTGRSPVPPAWSFGLWLSSSWTPSYDESVVLDFVEQMKKWDIPLSVFHYDAAWMKPFELCNFRWDKKFGDAREMLAKIKAQGVRVCVWMNPYISQRSYLFREGKEQGFLLKRKDGRIWQGDLWMPGMGIVDFTNPEACRWFQDKLGEILDMGVDCLKTDFAERIPTDVDWYDGSDPEKMHNYYSYLYHKNVFEVIREKKGERNAMVFGRSATVGTQQFPVNWGGDNVAEYDSMAESLRGGLSFCLSGFGFWAHDISGFDSTATPDLYKRWSAFGLLSTHSRLHGHDTYRVPWNFGEEACRVLGHFTRLKCSLMPYLFARAVEVNREGVPMMRPMMLEFPEDANCTYLDRQYMLGDALLVAPVFSESGEVSYYVPEGTWTNYLTGEILDGNRWYTQTFDYFTLPLLVRPNTVLATGSRNDTPEYDFCDEVTWHFFELEDNREQSVSLFRDNLEEGMKIQVRRERNTITAAVDGEGRYCIYLHNVKGAVCPGAKLEQQEFGIKVIPDAGQKLCRITLEEVAEAVRE